MRLLSWLQFKSPIRTLRKTASDDAEAQTDVPDLPPPYIGRGLWPRFDWRAHRMALVSLSLSVLVALLLVPQVLNFAHRDDYERSLHPLAPAWQPLEAIEYRLYDARFSSRGAVIPQSRERIAIVAIDQTSLDVLSEWPWPRSFHARLIDRLKGAGASAIVWDVNFSAKQNPKANGELSPADAAFVAASENAGNVLISAGFNPRLEGNGKGGQTATNVTSLPFDELDGTTPDTGFNWLPTNSSGETRRYAWRANVSGADVASLAALSVGLDGKKLDDDENAAFFKQLSSNRWPNARGESKIVPLFEMKIGQFDRVWTTPIFFWGPPGTFPTYGYSDVLNGKSGQWSPEELRKKFNKRIVFIGATAPLLKDVFGAPAFAVGDDGGQNLGVASAAQIAGVELHAGMAAQMLDGRYIHPPQLGQSLAWLFGLCAGGALWLSWLRQWVSRAARWAQAQWAKRKLPGRVHGMVWFGVYVLFGAWPLLGFWAWSQHQFAQNDNWIVMAYPLLGAALSSGLTLLLFFVNEAGERRKTVARLSRHVSPDVLDELLAHPEEENLRPFKREVTILFSDLEGFTSYSTTHDPEEVVDALNLYMSRMVTIVENHGGTLDKFMGDGIMAFFGAPSPRWDHAALGLSCAIEMQDECARFREETGINFYMRVGVHTGEVIVGYMGSEARADYTVLGDAVNLASRLEAKNKELGARIICSNDTYLAAAGAVIASLERVTVAGLVGLIEVWIVRGLAGRLPTEESWQPLPQGTDGTKTLPQASSSASPDSPNDTAHDFLDDGIEPDLLSLPQSASPPTHDDSR